MEEYKKYFEYLDELRESGVTNMFGAAPYIMRKFHVSKGEARTILLKWMSSFDDRHPES